MRSLVVVGSLFLLLIPSSKASDSQFLDDYKDNGKPISGLQRVKDSYNGKKELTKLHKKWEDAPASFVLYSDPSDRDQSFLSPSLQHRVLKKAVIKTVEKYPQAKDYFYPELKKAYEEEVVDNHRLHNKVAHDISKTFEASVDTAQKAVIFGGGGYVAGKGWCPCCVIL